MGLSATPSYWWKFEEATASDPRVDSIASKSLTPNNSPARVAGPGGSDYAVQLLKASLQTLRSSGAVVTPGTTFSIAAEVNLLSPTSNSNEPIASENGRWTLRFFDFTGSQKIQWRVTDTSGTTSSAEVSYATEDVFTPMVGRYDHATKTIKLTVAGTTATVVMGNTIRTTGTPDMVLGDAFFGNGTYANIQIANLSIWNGTYLTDDDVSQLMSGGGGWPGLLAPGALQSKINLGLYLGV